MDFLELAKARYSVRKFKDEPISSEHMARILEAANVAPTGCNYQPQRIYVVKSEGALAKINEASKCIFGAKTVLIFAYDKGEDWKNRLEEGVHSGVQDVSIVATHAMMEAWECGVGSCWVNFFSPTKLREIMGLPENEEVVCIMPIGYPADDAEPLANMHFTYKEIGETVKEL
ncbi:MAG: nitroreductase family protein [Saccharofermentans sp.]|nr:nitroreductase family protein [Saccharofermentans sp.]